jgi:hypothetical protein
MVHKKKMKSKNLKSQKYKFSQYTQFKTSFSKSKNLQGHRKKESTGGAAMKAMMNTEVAVNNVGIMITPNQPM